MHRFWLVPLLALGLAQVACSDDDDNQNNNNQPPPTLTVATYNGGLARGFVDHAEERAPLVADAVAGIGADVICVQEIWQPEHVDAVVTAAGSDYESVFLDPFPDPNPGPAACDASSLAPLVACVEQNCADVDPEDMDNCVIGQCTLQFGALTPDCQNCLAANIGGEIDEVLVACAEGNSAYAYGGSFGIGILSTAPITDSDHIVLDSHINRRGVIWAEIETEALGTVHVFCTHLSAVFADIPFPETTGTWAEEQADQVTALRAYVDQQAGTDGQVILLGDFNCGPGGTGWVAEVEANYTALVDGFTNLFPDSTVAACTFCDTNTLNGGIDHGDSVLIDHILLRNVTGTFTPSRILDSTVQVTVDGTPIDSDLSDHYGVQLVIDPAVTE